MTCKEIHEQITAYVDDRVDEAAYRAKLNQHLSACAECRAAYELELLTKAVIRTRAPRAAAPEELRSAIAGNMESISRERVAASAPNTGRPVSADAGRLDRFAHLFLAPVGVTAAMVLIALGAFALLREEEPPLIAIVHNAPPVKDLPRGSRPENLFNKASSNFRAIRDGKLSVGHSTADPTELRRYFHDNGVAYDIAALSVRAKLAGGVVSDHGETKFAHLVYTQGETIIYVFEIPAGTLQAHKVVYVADNALHDIEAGKALWEEPDPWMCVVVFKKGDVVCAVVANAPRSRIEQMIAIG